MKPGLLLLAAMLLAPLVTLNAADAPEPKPNIVFILVDDMPYAGPSATGNKLLQTPHMDRIAKEGMLFSRAYTEPLCGPSRAPQRLGDVPISLQERITTAAGQVARQSSQLVIRLPRGMHNLSRLPSE